MIIADNETAVDLLYYEAIARTVVRLVCEKSDEPLSVGIHGDWGAGKSSVLMMVEDAFAADDRVLCVRFNGWLFQGFEDAKAVLIETIVDELRRKRPASAKVAEQAKKVLRRVDWMKLARKAGAYGITLATGIPHPETIKDLGTAARALIASGANDVTPENIAAIVEGSNEFLREVEEDSAPEQMHAFREEFAELLERAEIDRLVVLVDDLDRCLPETAIETLEAIRLFLFVPRAAFVIAADEGMIEYAVRQHFPDLPVATGPATYARNYLEKLIQVPFRLPSLGYAETRIYVILLLVLNECGEESKTFKKLAELAREVLRRPWKGPGLDRKAIETALGNVPTEVERSMELAGRIAPILADGARGNPRQIKRFINTMMLRLAIAEERGFRDELKMSVLAKIMLAERFAPELYDAMARGSANTGASEELAALEAVVAAGPTGMETKSADGKESAPSTEASLPDWPNLEWAKQWAAIDPPLAENDLRPYVFVTRDRRSVFGAVTSLGELDELVAKLQGSPLQVKQAAAEIARLQSLEAEQVFDALRAKVRDTEDLTQEPVGVKGLAEMARQHPFLQRPLLSFVQDLPVSKLGPWVVSGWASAFSEADVASDFATTLKGWADQDDNKPLKAAATAAMKLSSKRKRS
ncbi:Qat anti-phage system ATPase QatA [Roseibium marinum]|uniref:Putative KAP-like P-loop ATPase n=1 Tax=Roseibium marinum TaxID=281252 RepID=A0A2S3V1R6_9HYPH|nr:Qat anti-phage system ATPase QatA [Roseibium marinum]POF33912.1 putative KAP-like P-loop ATPase [Roseibium marinum]